MDWLTTRPSPDVANHWLALLSLGLFAIGLIAAGVISTRPGLPPFSGKQSGQFVNFACTVVGWICGIGLFFHLMRLLQIDPGTLGRPIWIVLTWLSLVAATIWLISRASVDRELRSARQRSGNRKAHSKPV